MTKNYYHILGISPQATAPEIKGAYKRLALKFHPDKNPGNPHAEEQFKLVNEAYQVLSNPRRRATYDLQRQYEVRQRQTAAHANPRYHHTRPPAGYRERHYRQRPQRTNSFSKKDLKIMVGVVLLVILLVLGSMLIWDFVTYLNAGQRAQDAEQLGQWQQAHDYYSQVLEYRPDQLETRLKRADLRQNFLKDAQGALADYSWVLRHSTAPKAEWYAARGKSHLDLKHYEQAIQDFNTALFLAPTLHAVYQDRAAAYLQAENNWPAAISDLTHFVNSPSVTTPEKTEALLYRAFAHYRTQQWALAWHDTEQALAQDSLNGKAYFLQALLARQHQNQPLNCQLLAKAAQLGFKSASAELEFHCAGQ